MISHLCIFLLRFFVRIAAVSVAERMAEERAEDIGATIGYHIKLEKVSNPQRTRCLLMTTGVLLRKIQLEGFIGVSHLFIDEGESACLYDFEPFIVIVNLFVSI